MNAAMIGADVEGLELFARSLRTASECLTSIESQLSDAIRATRWTGPDGQRFGAEWPGDSARLRSTASALGEASAAVQRNAREQSAASAAGTAGAGADSSVGVGVGGFAGAGGGGGGGGGWGDAGTWQGSASWNGISGSASGSGHGSFGPMDLSASGSVETMTAHADASTYGHGLKYDPIHHEWIPAELGATAAVAYNLVAASGAVSAKLGAAELKAQGSAKVGAGAGTDAHVFAGPDGAGAQASIGGYAGAKIDGSVSGSIAGQEATASGHLTAGVEFHAQAEAQITLEKIEVGVSIGAALGIGGGLDFKIELDPAAAAEHLVDIMTHPSFPHLW